MYLIIRLIFFSVNLDNIVMKKALFVSFWIAFSQRRRFKPLFASSLEGEEHR